MKKNTKTLKAVKMPKIVDIKDKPKKVKNFKLQFKRMFMLIKPYTF
jgi:hypothetical protein